MPEFSIIIPVYKVEKYIRQCIESVLNQTFKDFEALVVDDCGGDSSIDIVKEYAKKDKRIKILYHKSNQGLAEARNTALDAAKGKYIVCLDSDDWMNVYCLDTIKATFEKHKTTSVWFNARKYYENTHSFQSAPINNQSEGIKILTPQNIAGHSDFTWIKAYTRESIQKYNLKWPKGLTFEDGEFYFKYFTLNPETYMISDCLINYRHRNDSIVRRANRGDVKMSDIYDVVKHLREFWIEHGVYDKYKTTILKLIQNRIKMAKNLSWTQKHIELSYKFLKDLHYPEDLEVSREDKLSQNEKKPLVSIVVPFYNVEKYIGQCLDSIINQTYRNIEIICVDDCGQDNSIQIVKEYAKKDKRIKIVRHKNNKGLGGARNTGLENAKGKYIFFIDSDDWINICCIQLTVEKLIETGLNTVFFKADTYYDKTKNLTPIWYPEYKNHPNGYFKIDEDNMCKLPHYSWNKGYRREFLINNKIKWQENVIYEDMEFFFKLFIASPYTYMIDEPLYIYRIRDDSIIGKCYKNLTKAEDLYTITKNIYDYLKSNNLMEKYKKSFLHLVTNNLNNYRSFPETHKKLVPLMLSCIEDINFPQSFVNCNNI